MDITFIRRNGWRVEYEIQTPEGRLRANRHPLSFRPRVRVSNASGATVALVHQKSFFYPRFEFTLSGAEPVMLMAERPWKGVFVCPHGDSEFRLFCHRKPDYSVFAGDRQIAAFTRNSVTAFRGPGYRLRKNRDADLPLLLSMVLAIDTIVNPDGDLAFETETSPYQARSFDREWQPTD